MAKGRRHTQSRSVQGFQPFIIDRRTEDELPSYIKGAALFDEVDNEEGYWVFDQLSSDYLAVEYDEEKAQWYFVNQDTRTHNWVATEPVPSSYRLGRRSVKPSTSEAIKVEETTKTRGQRDRATQQTDNTESSATMSTTQTLPTETVAAAALLDPDADQQNVQTFLSKPTGTAQPGGKPPGGSGPPGGGGGGGPPGGGGAPLFPVGGGAPPGQGTHGKLGGNPPSEFDGERSKADGFINEFSL